jgi:PAS domain S-box-containing protein
MKRTNKPSKTTGAHSNSIPDSIDVLHQTSVNDHNSRLELLELENKHLLTLFNHINDLVCEVDADGVYLYVNNQYKDILGYDSEDLIGRHVVENIHPDDLVTSIKRYDQLKKSRSNSSDIWRFKHKNGTYRIIESRGKVIDDGSPNPKTLVISRDITEQYEAEKAITDSEKKYRGLYQSLIDGYAMVSMDGKIIEFNKAFKDMLGYDNDELTSRSYQEITPAKWNKTEKHILENQVLIQGYSEVYRKEYYRKDGTIVPVELRVYLNKNDDNQPSGMWAITRDITEQIRTEENQLVLYQRLEEMNNMKDKFMSVMAHDLRGPFNSILGYSEIIKTLCDGLPHPAIRDNIIRINNTATQAFALLENLLSWANIQSSHMMFDPLPLNLKECISQIIAFYESAIQLKNIRISYYCDENLTIEADAQMLKTMLRNLISNAIKFVCSEGKVMVNVVETNGNVNIEINDSGLNPIKPGNTSFNSNPVKKLSDKGTGLGLMLVRDFAVIHGGNLTTDFNPEKGSRVTLSLPKTRK